MEDMDLLNELFPEDELSVLEDDEDNVTKDDKDQVTDGNTSEDIKTDKIADQQLSKREYEIDGDIYYGRCIANIPIVHDDIFSTNKMVEFKIYQNEKHDCIELETGGCIHRYFVNPGTSMISDVRKASLFYDLKQQLYKALVEPIPKAIPILAEKETQIIKRHFKTLPESYLLRPTFNIFLNPSRERNYAVPTYFPLYSYSLHLEADWVNSLKAIFASILEVSLRDKETSEFNILYQISDIFEDSNRAKSFSFLSMIEQIIAEMCILSNKYVHVFVEPPRFVLPKGANIAKHECNRYMSFLESLQYSRFDNLRKNLKNIVSIQLDDCMLGLVAHKGYNNIYKARGSCNIEQKLTSYGLRAVSNAVICCLPKIDAARKVNSIGRLRASHQRRNEEESDQSLKDIVKSLRQDREERDNEKTQSHKSSKPTNNRGGKVMYRGQKRVIVNGYRSYQPNHGIDCKCSRCKGRPRPTGGSMRPPKYGSNRGQNKRGRHFSPYTRAA